jgi:hypothetical protein
MTQGLKLSGPMMRRRTSFYGDQAWLEPSEQRPPPVAMMNEPRTWLLPLGCHDQSAKGHLGEPSFLCPDGGPGE